MKYWHWIIILGALGVAAVIGFSIKHKQPSTIGDLKQENTLLKGYNFSPRSFTAADISTFMTEAKQDGNAITWAGKWQDLKNTSNPALTVINQAKQYGLTPIIIVGSAKGEVFDGIFQQGFRETILNFVKTNKVPYLGIGNEVDQILLESKSRYDVFISAASSLAKDVHAASPQTKVFTTFQLESAKGLHGGLFGGKNDPTTSILHEITNLTDFDIVGFTSYPCLVYQSPNEIPKDYYSSLSQYTGTKPVVFTEIGWFREANVKGWESSESEQANFISRFKTLSASLQPKVVIWPFLYDPPVTSIFSNIGLLGKTASDSLGLQAWKSF